MAISTLPVLELQTMLLSELLQKQRLTRILLSHV